MNTNIITKFKKKSKKYQRNKKQENQKLKKMKNLKRSNKRMIKITKYLLMKKILFLILMIKKNVINLMVIVLKYFRFDIFVNLYNYN